MDISGDWHLALAKVMPVAFEEFSDAAQKLIQKAVLAERERCAKIAEAAVIHGHAVQAPSCAMIAKRIRDGTTS